MMGIPALAFTALLAGILTPTGWLALTGAAAAIMTPGLVQCARLRRWP
jgi:hypothetical protein